MFVYVSKIKDLFLLFSQKVFGGGGAWTPLWRGPWYINNSTMFMSLYAYKYAYKKIR